MQFVFFGIHEENVEESTKSLAHEFFDAPCPEGGDTSVLEGWFTEQGVSWSWVRHVADGASSGKLEHTSDARSWILALAEITETIRSTASLLPGRGSVGLPSIYEDEESEAEGSIPEILQFARFIQETMLKMLAFVDFLVALDPIGVPALHQKIHVLLCVRGAMSNALSEIEVLFISTPSVEVERIRVGMVNLLYAKNAKARESIRSTLEEIRTSIMESTVDSLGTQIPQGSSDIHKLTLSVMAHITFLLDNYLPLDPIVTEAVILGKYVPRNRIMYIPPLDSMVMEMTSYLEDRLLDMSESFLDQGLRFLFLINNSNFICHSLHNSTTGFAFLQFHVSSLLEKVDGYKESYLHVSWAPVLSCLLNPTPRCFGKTYSLLPKFESEFQKTYTTQKLWKVPDPEMRKRLRKAVTEKIISGYTKYIENNNVTTANSTPQNLEEMLQELFEG
ncbi:exocyst complex component EXO70A3-like [Miscanthus floridulus]|uniref:exocyst complex component EXO70A3-like n=1 Tax=Miscanthus floridulus TaxID=154761 RepID=UPI00345991DD